MTDVMSSMNECIGFSISSQHRYHEGTVYNVQLSSMLYYVVKCKIQVAQAAGAADSKPAA